MAAKTTVPITGAVLRWAIEEAGLTREQFAQKMKVSPDTVYGWETGQEAPLKTQFKLITEKLRRPSAVFFLPSPPERRGIRPELRQPPGVKRREYTPEEARWIRAATRLQGVCAEILEEVGERPLALPRLDPQNPGDPEQVAESQRRQFGVTINQQVEWRDLSEAFHEWRSALEAAGVLVFQLGMGRPSARGFSIWNELAPLIVVNTAYNTAARIFTLFHEYAHLLTRTDSLCLDSRAFRRHKVNGDIERWCESFAASFLLPKADLLQTVKSISAEQGLVFPNFDTVSLIAERYKVSLRAAALRLVELESAPQKLYDEVARKASISEQERQQGGGRGVSRPKRRLREYGRRFASIVFTGYRSGILRLHDIVDSMRISPTEVNKLATHLEENRQAT